MAGGWDPAPGGCSNWAPWFWERQTELVIKSPHVVPAKLLTGGFHFLFPKIDAAIADLINQTRAPRKTVRQKLQTRMAPIENQQ